MTLQNYEENPYDFMYGMFSKNTYVNNIFLDTFASKTAAIQDETADASVGNVTGSNAVNVFLGIGIAWSMAAIYWEAQGEIPQPAITDLNTKSFLKQKTIQNFTIDAQWFRKTKNENPPTQEIGVPR